MFIVEPDREQLAELVRRAAAGEIRPRIGAVFPLAEAREAFAAKQKDIGGKVLVVP